MIVYKYKNRINNIEYQNENIIIKNNKHTVTNIRLNNYIFDVDTCL